MIKITNLWVHANFESSTDEFWYIDYENGNARHLPEGPKHESARKWSNSIVDFLQNREIEILEQGKEIIKFKPIHS